LIYRNHTLFLLVSIFLLTCSCDSRSPDGLREPVVEYMKEESRVPKKMRPRASSPGKADKLHGDTVQDEKLSEQKDPDREKRMVVYRGEFRIGTDSVKDSVHSLKTITEKYKGYTEHISSNNNFHGAVVRIRVPAEHFDAAIDDVKRIGKVLSKKISARDVTTEFNDIFLRTETAKKVRDRLYLLLKNIRKASERIKVLREIERLTTDIETWEAEMNFLQSQAAYSTIVVTLTANRVKTVQKFVPSPFNWIRVLNPDNIYPGYKLDKNIEFTSPEGFFNRREAFEKRETPYMLTVPGNRVKLRVGTVKNYPKAGLDFWEKAIARSAENRKYDLVKKIDISSEASKVGGSLFQISRNRLYLIAILIAGEKIVIAEALFENDKAFKEYEKNVGEFLKSMRYES